MFSTDCIGVPSLYVTLLCKPAYPYLLCVIVLLTGNPVVPVLDSKKTITECAPCADSFFSLKEQIMNLDEMGLELHEDDEIAATDDEESLA